MLVLPALMAVRAVGPLGQANIAVLVATRTPEQAADAVLAASSDADLAALARCDEPDPWLVADALLARGRVDAAARFARADPRVDMESLPGFVASRVGRPVRLEGRGALVERPGTPQPDQHAALTTPNDDPIGSIHRLYEHGSALRAAERWCEAARTLLAAGREASTVGWLRMAAQATHEAGIAAEAADDRLLALEAYEVRLREVGRRGDRARVAKSYARLALLHGALGEYAQSLDFYRRAYELMTEIEDRRGAAVMLANIGNAHHATGNFPAELRLHQRAVERMTEIGQPGDLARTLGGLGNARASIGDYAGALEAHLEALAMYRKSGDRSGMAWALCNAGTVHYELGDFPRALDFQEQALAINEELGDRARIADALGSLGLVHEALGDFLRAIELQQRALALKSRWGDRDGVATATDGLASLYLTTKDYPRALALAAEALRLREELGDRAGAALALASIGEIQQALGKTDAARATLERAAAQLAALGDRANVAATHGSLATIASSIGDHAHAVELARRAIGEAEGLGAGELIVRGLARLARVEASAGDVPGALEAARRSVEAMGRLGAGLGDEQGATAREQFAEVFSIGTRFAHETGDTASLAYFLESGRAVTLLEALGGRDSLRSFVIPDDLRLEEATARARESAASLASAAAPDEPRALRALASAQASVGEVVDRIQRSEKAAASVVYPKADSLAAIESRLKDDEALVIYGIYTDHASALVVTRRAARPVPLREAAAIEAACSAGDWPKLRELVVEPLALDEHVRRLFVSPMGALCAAPFVLLAPRQEVVYVPSGTTYGVLLEQAKQRGEGILALGDPDYAAPRNDRAAATYDRGGPLRRLPATADEARSIGDTVLLGGRATERGLAAAIATRPRWRAVHFACHGLVNADQPRFSSLALTPADGDDGFLTTIEVFRSKIPADLVVLSACETARGKSYRTEGTVGFVRAFLLAGSPRVIVSLWKVDDAATQALMTQFYRLWNPKDGTPGLPAATALRQAQEFMRTQGGGRTVGPRGRESSDPTSSGFRPKSWSDPEFWAAWQLWGLPD